MTYAYPFSAASEDVILDVWAKGKIIPRYDATLWRWDVCGKPIRFSEHGNRNSPYGWEIDHIKPRSLGGSDALENLQPLQWENNHRKAETYPWPCRQDSRKPDPVPGRVDGRTTTS